MKSTCASKCLSVLLLVFYILSVLFFEIGLCTPKCLHSQPEVPRCCSGLSVHV